MLCVRARWEAQSYLAGVPWLSSLGFAHLSAQHRPRAVFPSVGGFYPAGSLEESSLVVRVVLSGALRGPAISQFSQQKTGWRS